MVDIFKTLYRYPAQRLHQTDTVERCFNKLKNARRVATRYDKTAESFLGFIDITSIRLWVRLLSTRPKQCYRLRAVFHPPAAAAPKLHQNSHKSLAQHFRE